MADESRRRMFVYAKLRGVCVPWPVELLTIEDQMARVFVKSDNAEMTVKRADVQPFRAEAEHCRQSTEKLVQKKLFSTLQCYQKDLDWAAAAANQDLRGNSEDKEGQDSEGDKGQICGDESKDLGKEEGAVLVNESSPDAGEDSQEDKERQDSGDKGQICGDESKDLGKEEGAVWVNESSPDAGEDSQEDKERQDSGDKGQICGDESKDLGKEEGAVWVNESSPDAGEDSQEDKERQDSGDKGQICGDESKDLGKEEGAVWVNESSPDAGEDSQEDKERQDSGDKGQICGDESKDLGKEEGAVWVNESSPDAGEDSQEDKERQDSGDKGQICGDESKDLGKEEGAVWVNESSPDAGEDSQEDKERQDSGDKGQICGDESKDLGKEEGAVWVNERSPDAGEDSQDSRDKGDIGYKEHQEFIEANELDSGDGNSQESPDNYDQNVRNEGQDCQDGHNSGEREDLDDDTDFHSEDQMDFESSDEDWLQTQNRLNATSSHGNRGRKRHRSPDIRSRRSRRRTCSKGATSTRAREAKQGLPNRNNPVDVVYSSDVEDEQTISMDIINLVNIIDSVTTVNEEAADECEPDMDILDSEPENSSESESDVLDETKIIRDANNSNIFIRKVLKSSDCLTNHQKKKDRVYNSVHACLFCGQFVSHIRAHLKCKHKKEESMKEILTSSDSEYVNTSYNLLRAKGDDKHNCQVIADGKGELLLSRRPVDKLSAQNYGPCPKCREWMLKNTIPRHQAKCKSADRTRLSKKNLFLQSNIISGRFKSTASKMLQEEVFTTMKLDETSEIAQKDPLIILLGESWLRRNISNKLKRKYYTSSRMRLAAKLLSQLRALDSASTPTLPVSPSTVCHVAESPTASTSTTFPPAGSAPDNSTSTAIPAACTKPLWNFLTPECFDKVVKAAHLLSLPEMDDDEDLRAPSNAIKLKYDIQRLVNAKWACIMKTGGSGADSCKSFLELMKIEWSDQVTRLARAVLDGRRLQQKSNELIPDPKDIGELVTHIKEELKAAPQSKDFRTIATYVQARLLIYNKRRSGEIDAVFLKNYAARQTELKDIDRSLIGDLTKLEEHLLMSQQLMMVRGKRSRPVPILLPNDTYKALAYLADPKVRRAAGIKEDNKYLFATTGQGTLRSYESIRNICDKLGLKSPERITSVNLRKYTATLSQVLDLNQNQMDWLCNHLGHSKQVHKDYYRQMSGFLERTEVAKVFLIQDLGLAGKFVGKKTSDLTAQDILEAATDKCSDVHVPPDPPASGKESSNVWEWSSDDDEDESGPRKKAKLINRVKWTQIEMEEIQKYFKDFLKTKTTPGQKFCHKVIKLSRAEGGQLHRRTPPLII